VLGRRASRTDSFTGDVTHYDYDGDVLIGEYWVPGSVESGPATYTHYHWGADGLIGDSRDGGAGGSASLFPTGGGIDGGPALDWLSAAVAGVCQQPGGTWYGGRYYNYTVQGDVSSIMGGVATHFLTSHGMDSYGNPLNYGPQAPAYTQPPTPIYYNGYYRDPYTGYDSPAAGGLNGYYNPAYGDEIDDFPVDASGRALPYVRVRRGINRGAGAAYTAVETAASLNPLVNAIEAGTGQKATRRVGCRLSLGERIGSGLGLVPWSAVVGKLGKVGSAVSSGDGLIGKAAKPFLWIGERAKQWYRARNLPFDLRATQATLEEAKMQTYNEAMAAMRRGIGTDPGLWNPRGLRPDGKDVVTGFRYQGTYWVTSGHHRTSAAVRIWIEDGNPEPLRAIIQPHNFEVRPEPLTSTWYRFPLKPEKK
jgi:hypothetical protein